MALMGLQGVLGQAVQGGGSDNKKLEQERRWAKLKDMLGRGAQGAAKGSRGEFGQVDPKTKKKTYSSKFEEMADTFKSKRPLAESKSTAPDSLPMQSEESSFKPSAVKSAKFGDVNLIKPQEFDFQSKLEIIRKLMGV